MSTDENHGKQQQLLGEGEHTKVSVTKLYPVGGPLWFNVMAMIIVHTFPGVFILTAMNRVPFVGESPTWLRAIVLASSIGSGIGSHLWHFIGMTPKVRNNVFNLSAGVATLNVVFFFTEVYHACGTGVMIAGIIAVVGIVASSGVYYKKATEESAPQDIVGIVDSLQTNAGLIAHGIIDFGNTTLFIILWYLAGRPSLFAWM